MGERHTKKVHAKEGLSKACDLFDRKRMYGVRPFYLVCSAAAQL